MASRSRSPRTPPSWRKRPPPAPWTAEEDAELANMITCGLCAYFYQVGLPHRPFGEILQRRLDLVHSGQVQRARPI